MTISTTLKKIVGVAAIGATLTAVTAGILVTRQHVEAAASDYPIAQIQLGDANDGSPNHPGDCGVEQSFPWAGQYSGGQANDGWATTIGDADCMKVRLQSGNPGTEYTRDFRVCLTIDFPRSCTPYASEGGGTALIADDGAFRLAGIFVDDRPAPLSGMRFTNVQIGVQLHYQKDRGSCRGSSGMQWASSPAPTDWVYGERDDDDPGCASVGLRADQVADPNADYISTTLPTLPAEASASTSYNGSVTMKNTGQEWNSNNIAVPESQNCGSNVPNDGDVCTDTMTVESSNFYLKKAPSSSPELTAPDTLPYRRVISVRYERVNEEICEIEWHDPTDDPGGDDYPILTDVGSRNPVARALVPVAYATDPVGVPVCNTFNYVQRTETPLRDVYADAQAIFPVAMRTGAERAQPYHLVYQMYKSSTNQSFGEVADIPIKVSGGTTPIVGLACPVATQPVTAGNSGDYQVTVEGVNGFAGDVTVALQNPPSGVTASPRTVTLPPSPKNVLMVVNVGASVPAGTSTLTFRATAAGVGPADCSAELRVIRAGEPSLRIAPPSVAIDVHGLADFVAWYDADGDGSGEVNVTNEDGAAWSSANTGIASSTAIKGRFIGVAQGITQAIVAFQGRTASGTITVGNPPVTPSFVVEPDTACVRPNQTISLKAWYDSDGPGAQGRVDVTTTSAWTSDNVSVLASQGGGVFRGVDVGTTTARATYTPASGSLFQNVSSVTVTNTCTGAGNEALLLEPRASIIEQVGGTASVKSWFYPDGFAGSLSRVLVTEVSQWRSAMPSIAIAVPTTPGVYRAVATGTAPIWAEYTSTSSGSLLTATGTVSVTPVGGGDALLRLSPDPASVRVGSTVTLIACYDPDGAADPQPCANVPSSQVTWSSLNPGIASSQRNGVYRGVAEGRTTARGSYTPPSAPQVTDDSIINVTANNATLTLEPNPGTIEENQQIRITAWYDPDGAGGTPRSDVSGSAAWSTLSPINVRSNNGGLFTALRRPSGNIRATYTPPSAAQLTANGVINITPRRVNCTFGASPTAIFIPPTRPVTLTWNCDGPTTCQVRTPAPAARPDFLVGSGGQNGNVVDRPTSTTTYRLTCQDQAPPGFLDRLVRVFDISTRVEILPR